MQQVIPMIPDVILGKILPDPKSGDSSIRKHVTRTLRPGSCGCKAIDRHCQACSHPDLQEGGCGSGVRRCNLCASLLGRWHVSATVCPCSWLSHLLWAKGVFLLGKTVLLVSSLWQRQGSVPLFLPHWSLAHASPGRSCFWHSPSPFTCS